jgi:DNA integrity scanning protein DisA with diadenylate cyclase activity
MKNLLFVLGLIIFVVIALRILYWAVSHVIIIAVVAAVIYFGVRMLLGRRSGGA